MSLALGESIAKYPGPGAAIRYLEIQTATVGIIAGLDFARDAQSVESMQLPGFRRHRLPPFLPPLCR